MLRMGFIEQVGAIIDELPTDRMTMLFSATLAEGCRAAVSSIYAQAHRYRDRNAGSREGANRAFSHYRSRERQVAVLQNVLVMENPDNCIIFCRTQEHVDHLFRQLDQLDFPCDKIHGGMVQDDRFLVMNAFKRGEFRFLVATDVAARGIDVEDITHVINYDLPMEKESYVHRIGRTGRAGKTGKAITFVTPNEDKFLADIEGYLGFEIPRKERSRFGGGCRRASCF